MRIFSLAALLSVLMFTSCSSDEPSLPSAEILEREAQTDIAYSRSLTDGLASATYKLSKLYVFDQSSLTNNKWVYKDMSDYVGWSVAAPSTIVIEDGKAYTAYETFSSATGPTRIGMVWDAYLYRTKQSISLCLYSEFRINDEDNSLTIGNRNFKAHGITRNSFQMEHVSRYEGGDSKNGGYHKQITIHEAAAHISIGKGILAFESEKELVKEVINRARAEFGDIVDLNEIYKKHVEFDNPDLHRIDLNELAKTYGIE